MHRFSSLVVALLALCVGAHAVDFYSQAYLTPQSEVFVSGMQRFVTMKNKKSSLDSERFDKTTYKPTAVALGYRHSTEQLTLGISASFETGNIKYRATSNGENEFAKVRDQTWGITLFSEYRFCDGWYVNGSSMLGFASQKLKSGYDIPGGEVYSSNGSSNSLRFGVSLEAGKRIELGNSFIITPHAGFDYAHIPGKDIRYRENGVTEYSDWESQNFYEIPVGVTFARQFDLGCDWVVVPSLDLTVISSVGNMKERSMNNRPGFASRTGSEWKVYGIGASHWGGRVTTGIQAVKAGNFDLGVNYAYEGRKKYHDHRISASMGFAF